MKPLVVGDRVFHPKMKAWGVGKVLSISPAGIAVFFIGGGHKLLSAQHVSLILAEGDDAHHPLLDNLSTSAFHKDSVFLALPDAIQKFLTQYPGGFRGEKFAIEERDHKYKAHTIALSQLEESKLTALLSEENFAEICERAKRVESSTHLLASFEKIQFNDALKKPKFQKLFAEALISNLYGESDEQSRFNRFAEVLGEMNVAKWPVVTYFGYIRYPEQRIFIKPEVTQNAAAVCGWEIGYKSELNWGTYTGVRGLFDHLRVELNQAGLAPRDMIDVQSFIWCIAPPAMHHSGKAGTK